MKTNKVMKLMGLLLPVMILGPHAYSNPKAAVQVKESQVPLYLVGQYDPQRDPVKDLVQALKLAKKENRNVILQVGGNWCVWCKKITNFFYDDQPVRDVLSKNYVIMKVNYSNENKNEKFLAAYPRIYVFPHLFVLNSSGKLLCSQFTGDLEKGSSYGEKAVLAFLNKWRPAAIAKRKTAAAK